MFDPEKNASGITVGELIAQLQQCDPKDPVCFGAHGHFTFYRVKDRDGVTQIEFNEARGVDYELLEGHPYVAILKKRGLWQK
jgi:hypothetical protein